MQSLAQIRIVPLAFVIFSMSASAAEEFRDGGNAVVCKTSQRAEMFDLYEAKTLRGVTVDLTVGGRDPYQIARDRLNMLAPFDPKSLKIYLANLDHLKSDIGFEPEIMLHPLDDSAHAFVPKDPDCEVKQLAVLRKKLSPNEKRILVKDEIWKMMPYVQQAALLLHEVIHKRLALLGETDSTKARYLVSYLMSSKPRDQGGEGYWKMIKDLRLPIYK